MSEPYAKASRYRDRADEQDMAEKENPKDTANFWHGVAHGFRMVAEHVPQDEDREAMLQFAADCTALARDLESGKPFGAPPLMLRLGLN